MATERTTYSAMEELVRRYEAQGGLPDLAEQSLTRFEHRVFSQNGEDGVLAELLRRIGVGDRWFVEFGIETGIEGNCVFLADVLGWTGLFMEADEDAAAAIERKYAASAAVQTMRALVGPENIQDLLESAAVPREIDVLSIDVDGNDYWIWQAITDYAPRIVVIEYNAHWPPAKRWVQPYDPKRSWQGTDNFGASLGALQHLGEKKGYRLVHTELAGANAFFVREDIDAVLPDPEIVPARAPNFFLGGFAHPPHPDPVPPVVDLERPEGTLVTPERSAQVQDAAAPVEAAASSRARSLNPTEVERRIGEHAFWWHSIDLGNGVVTPGHKPAATMGQELAALELPDLQGKSVLDIGAWDGYFSFAAERLGAARVVALDYYTWGTDPLASLSKESAAGEKGSAPLWDPVNLPGKAGFDLAHEALGSRVESVFGDLLAPDVAATLGEFDVVLFLGVLYHTRFPGEMLERVAALTRELMVLETESFSLAGYEELALGEFFETDELAGDTSNWWSFTEPALAGLCRSSGFSSVRFLQPLHAYAPDEHGRTRHRALAHARK